MATYKIIGFDKATGVLTINFSENMAPLTVDVPLTEDGLYITGPELDSYIQGFIPTWHLDRVNKIASGIPNEADIEALVVTPEGIDTTTAPIEQAQADANIAMWTDIEQEKQIARILVKFGLLQQDPTQISTTQL